MASGKYIVFLDGDDYINTTLFENLYKAYSKLEPDILIWGYKAFDYNGKILYENKIKYECINNKMINGKDYLINYDCPETVWMQMYRLGFLKENRLEFSIELKHNEDTNFIPRVLYYAKKIALSQERPICYVIRENSISHVRSVERCYYSLLSGKLLNKFNISKVAEVKVKSKMDKIVNR